MSKCGDIFLQAQAQTTIESCSGLNHTLLQGAVLKAMPSSHYSTALGKP